MKRTQLWLKILLGTLLGMLLSASLVINLLELYPIEISAALFTGLIIGFVIWSSTLTYFCSQAHIRKPLIYCTVMLVISLAINVINRSQQLF